MKDVGQTQVGREATSADGGRKKGGLLRQHRDRQGDKHSTQTSRRKHGQVLQLLANLALTVAHSTIDRHAATRKNKGMAGRSAQAPNNRLYREGMGTRAQQTGRWCALL